ncbi:tachykinin-like peptides receptor 86C [Dermacentor variabilis]|uniref:tachykinin-like peptides receptor 86C n=1 Tax=Dermacentor variabilis TaxID=34621 RepID=UPI003F5B769E
MPDPEDLYLASEVLNYLRNRTSSEENASYPLSGFTGAGRRLYIDLLDGFNNTTTASVSTSKAAGTAVVNVNSDRQFVLAVWIQLLYALFFGVMVLVAALGNATVIWIVLAHQRMRTVTNYFLVNLSVADLLTSTLNAAFNLVYMLESHWAFGEPYCIFSNFVASLTVACSAFTMAAMSIDRYFAVVRPLWARLPRWLALAAVCGVWTASALLSLPNLLYSRTRSYRYADGSVRTVCLLMWPDGPAYMSHIDYVYNVLFLVLTYVVPVITMVVTYTGMGVVLWGSRGIGESTERQQNVLQAKRKVVRMLIAVVTLFSVSWLPYNAYFVYVSHNPHVAYLDHIQHVYLAMYWLAMSHAMCNPIVYYCMNKRFRSYFRQALCWCFPKPEATKTVSANGRAVHFQTSWTDRQQTMRVSMCSHAVLLSKDRLIAQNGGFSKGHHHSHNHDTSLV